MGSLKQMINFLDKNEKNILSIQDKLEKIQIYFNDNFKNVEKIRNDEIQFLQKEFFSNQSVYPTEIVKIYNKKVKLQEKEYQKNLNTIIKRRDKLKEKFSILQEKKDKHFKLRKSKNLKIDGEEEKLKKKILKLDDTITEYNKNIDVLNTGFGFIKNIFKMKKVENRKEELISKRDEFIEDIELIREKWKKQHSDYVEKEHEIKENWINTQLDLSLTEEKTETLTRQKTEIIQKAAFIKTLESLKGNEKFLELSEKPRIIKVCKRCKSKNQVLVMEKNTSNKFFCYYCGERFHENRQDVMGSLVEISELNFVYHKLQEGIKKSVSLIALLTGFNKGITAFKKSVADVKSSQDRYASLSKLKIDIPKITQTIGGYIDDLNKTIIVKYYNLHPLELTNSVKNFTETQLIEKNIKQFFSLMGDNLNNSTKAQW